MQGITVPLLLAFYCMNLSHITFFIIVQQLRRRNLIVGAAITGCIAFVYGLTMWVRVVANRVFLF